MRANNFGRVLGCSQELIYINTTAIRWLIVAYRWDRSHLEIFKVCEIPLEWSMLTQDYVFQCE